MYNPSELCRKLVVPRDIDQRFYPGTCRMMPERVTLPTLGLDSLQLQNGKYNARKMICSVVVNSILSKFITTDLLRQAGGLNACVKIALSVMNEL